MHGSFSMTKFFKKLSWYLGYTLYLFAVIIILFEIILRVYNPLPTRIKDGRLIISSNRTYYHTNKNGVVSGLDEEIKIHHNSIGFRGPEKPKNYPECLSIITMGGSTTHCMYITEGKTWPDLLAGNLSKEFNNVWLNNAGINGQSSFGHLLMLSDYVLPQKPKVIIFMTGVNDMGRKDLAKESVYLKDSSSTTLREFLLKNSEVFNICLTIIESNKVKRFGIPLPNVDIKRPGLDSISLPDSFIREKLSENNEFLHGYGERLRDLILTCKSNDIFPIFLTQPVLPGNLRDSITGVNLATIKLVDSLSSGIFASAVQLYNNRLKEVTGEMNVPCIDLAALLPKSSLYYFDLMHYTNAGCEKIAQVITPLVKAELSFRFSEYLKK